MDEYEGGQKLDRSAPGQYHFSPCLYTVSSITNLRSSIRVFSSYARLIIKAKITYILNDITGV